VVREGDLQHVSFRLAYYNGYDLHSPGLSKHSSLAVAVVRSPPKFCIFFLFFLFFRPLLTNESVLLF